MGNTINDRNIDEIVQKTHNTIGLVNGITKGVVLEYILKPWNWKHFSEYFVRYGFTDKFLIETFHKGWDWDVLSENEPIAQGGKSPKVSLQIIKGYHFKFNWKKLTKHPKVLENIEELVSTFPDKDFDWDVLSGSTIFQSLKNGKVIKVMFTPTLAFLEKLSDKPLNWKKISGLSSLTEEFIIKHIQKPFDWNYLSNNFPFSIEFIKEYSAFLVPTSCILNKINSVLEKEKLKIDIRKGIAMLKAKEVEEKEPVTTTK